MMRIDEKNKNAMLWHELSGVVQDPPSDSSARPSLSPSTGMPQKRPSMGANALGPSLYHVLLDQKGQPSTVFYASGRALAMTKKSDPLVMEVLSSDDLWQAVVAVFAARKLA
eukprot:gnl/TRDRNA2_/TRDRNA2_150901_c2_seq1.p3 gnl/TRDRNA2_/TRDRNA2_150901_c2~~gnl/TRDRNA2_/TRDRNA2_150901_c2_seq1.p3  ORF type:complete len:112 (+),score=25.71 gnl/TRDRNA2_/TRDRNA2_150901_c2_seq1:175-510(+)